MVDLLEAEVVEKNQVLQKFAKYSEFPKVVLLQVVWLLKEQFIDLVRLA